MTCSKLKQLKLVYLALETRTGKTMIALESCRLYGANKILFVTKKKVIGSILKDYKYYKDCFDCVVINYESVLKAKDVYDIVICDEAHSLGAYPKPAKRYKDIKSISNETPVILMSATPSPESYSQLYHQFTVNKYHSWAAARNFYQWAGYYVNIRKKYMYGREINDYSQACIEKIEKKTSEYFITYTQKQAGFTQQVKENILTCKIKDETMQLINFLNADKIVKVNGLDVLGDTAVKLMSKVHQLSSGTVISEDGQGIIIDFSKAEFIKEYFKNKKIAIFYKFTQEFELLKIVFKNWTASPEDFQSNYDTTFLGQFQSAREGIRLDKADALIFYNIDFSYLSYEQSKNRIISKERDMPAPLYFIFSNQGIEHKIYKVVKNKEDFTIYHYRKEYGTRYTKKTGEKIRG